jgi:hypothetical protein
MPEKVAIKNGQSIETDNCITTIIYVKYHKSPVWNCHSEDKHSISIGILIPSTTKYINMCSIVFIVSFFLITGDFNKMCVETKQFLTYICTSLIM